MSDVYYKIYLSSSTGKYHVVCMQWFDEHDYDKDKFLKDKDGNPYQFNDYEYTEDSWGNEPSYVNGEKRAKEFLNRVIKPEFIHEDDLLPNNHHMYKIPIDEWEE